MGYLKKIENFTVKNEGNTIIMEKQEKEKYEKLI